VKRVVYLDLVIGLLIVILIVTLSVGYFDVYFERVGSNSPHSISKVILIDAGHGGIDGGAVGAAGTIEKNINLSIAKKLKGYLEEQGYTVIMVRETDEGLYLPYGTIRDKKNQDLKKRKELIDEYKVDVFLSIHLNKFVEEKYYGSQVFYLKGDEGSQKLARSIQKELQNILNRGNKRVEKPSNDYYLFKGNKIPSVIVECGFLSNHEEEKLLNDDEYQNKLAWSIFSGLIKYFTEESNSNI
jgi:N-acetylmuramoyl-L-alanine amidase